MARPRNHAKHLSAAVEGLVNSLSNLVSTLGTTVSNRASAVVSAVTGKKKGQRGPGKNNPKLKAAIKASWARMTVKERKARVRRMLAGRGLKPKKG
jgi:hypothetical protein